MSTIRNDCHGQAVFVVQAGSINVPINATFVTPPVDPTQRAAGELARLVRTQWH